MLLTSRKCCLAESVLCFMFLLGTGLLGEFCIWQGLAGGNVEVFKDFYIEVILNGNRKEGEREERERRKKERKSELWRAIERAIYEPH